MLKLKEFRIRKGLSQSQLARIVDVHPAAIGNYEQGTREPSISTLTKIAVALGVTVDDLIDFQALHDQIHKELFYKLELKEKEPKC